MFLLYYSTIAIIFQYLYVFLHKIHKYISTNIKTSLRAATVAVDSIRNISAGAYIGSDGLFDTGTLAAYKQQLEGLTVTQQKMALMTTNLTAAQREQVLSYIASTTATKTLTAEQVLSCTADEKRILVKAGLIAEEELENGAVINLTQEKLKEILADETLNATEKNTILTKFGVTGANLTEASSWEVLGKSIGKTTVAMLKWLFLTPAGWATIAIAGVTGLIGAYAKWGPTLENTRKKLEDLKSECETLASDLSSVNSELETTKQRINELEGKESLTFVEAEELENLKKQNNELERTIDLLELEQRTKNKEKNKTFVDTMEKDVYSTDYYKDGLGGGKIKKGQAGRSEHRTTTTEQAYIIQQFNDREKFLDDIANAETEAERKRIQEQIDKIDKYLSDRNDQFKSDAEGIDYIQNPTTEDDKKVNEWLDYINEFQDKMAIAMGGENSKENAFNRLVDNWKFDELLNPLQKLGKEGKVTLDDLKSRMGDPVFAEFVNKLVEIGVISDNTDGSLRYLANAFNGTATSARNYVTALKGNDLNNFIDNLGEEAKALGTTESELAKLTAAHVIFNNTGLSTEQQQQALQMLASKIATTSTEMKYLLTLFNYASGNFNVAGASTMTDQERRARSVHSRAYLKEKYGIDLSPIPIPEKEEVAPYTPSGGDGNGGGGSGGGGNSSGSDKNEVLDKYLEDAEKRYKVHQDETRYINELNYALHNLAKTEEEQIDISDKIDEAYRDLADNRIKDIEHQIELQEKLNGENVNVLEYYDKIQSIASEEADRLRGIGYDDNSNEIQELQNKWWDAQNKKLDFYSKQHENIIRDVEHAMDMATESNPYADTTSFYQQLKDEYHKEAERLRALDPEKYKEEIHELQLAWWEAHNAIVDWRWNNSQNWISDRNTYNDWALFDDSEVDAWERVVKWLKEEYPNDLEKIKEAEQSLFEARKKEFDKANDLGNTYIESQKTLLQSYYDVTNSIAEAQHEINKELETSKTMYEWLDEDTRKLLFNQEDYNVLSEELYDIQYRADKLKRQYERDLENSTLSTVEAITSNYEMQYETLMKSYEIAKADLEVAKKKQKLNNVLSERNVRMFINGQWQWVANTEDVINAKSELADAEYAKRVEESGLAQQQSIDNLTKQQDELSVVINKFENGVIDLEEAIDLAIGAIGNLPSALSSMYSSARINSPSYSSGSRGSFNGVQYDSNTDYMAKIQRASTLSEALSYNDKRNAKIIGEKLNTETLSSSDVEKLFKNKHADGTNYTHGGMTLLGEEGFEAYISSNGHLIPIKQPTVGNISSGGIVFNTEQMKSLRTLWDMSNINIDTGVSLLNNSQPRQIDQSQDNRIIIDKLVVDNGSSDGQALVSALRRYIGNH